jgi:hypothetical protein
MTDKHEKEDLSGLSPNDADRKGAGSGAEPSEDAGAGYGNHAQPDAAPDAGLDGEPGDASLDGE